MFCFLVLGRSRCWKWVFARRSSSEAASIPRFFIDFAICSEKPEAFESIIDPIDERQHWKNWPTKPWPRHWQEQTKKSEDPTRETRSTKCSWNDRKGWSDDKYHRAESKTEIRDGDGSHERLSDHSSRLRFVQPDRRQLDVPERAARVSTRVSQRGRAQRRHIERQKAAQ